MAVAINQEEESPKRVTETPSEHYYQLGLSPEERTGPNEAELLAKEEAELLARYQTLKERSSAHQDDLNEYWESKREEDEYYANLEEEAERHDDLSQGYIMDVMASMQQNLAIEARDEQEQMAQRLLPDAETVARRKAQEAERQEKLQKLRARKVPNVELVTD